MRTYSRKVTVTLQTYRCKDAVLGGSVRAAVVQRYGSPEQVRVVEVTTPVPRAGEVRVRVGAAAVTSADARIRGARFPRGFGPFARLAFGFRGPRRPVLGSAFSGTIEACGPGVEGWAAGDRVCGMTGTKMGAHAEYLVVRATRLVRTPVGVDHDAAAGVLFGGTTAKYFLEERTDVGPGTTVLVNGASGAIGTNAVQLARQLGATVTAVTSTPNLALVSALGADHVVDHTEHDVVGLDERFDVVLDAVGNLSISAGRALLAPGGRLVLVVADLGATLRSATVARGDVVAGASPEDPVAMTALVELVAVGLLEVVVGEVYQMDDIVDAHRRVDGGHKVGNVLVRP